MCARLNLTRLWFHLVVEVEARQYNPNNSARGLQSVPLLLLCGARTKRDYPSQGLQEAVQ